jgi:cell wall-associated NlpC family hydrolase
MNTRTISLAAFALCAAMAVGETPVSAVRKEIVETALSYRGVPYVYGAESPRAFDCSGFVRYVFGQAAGIPLPRTSKAQWASGKPTTLAAAKPGTSSYSIR